MSWMRSMSKLRAEAGPSYCCVVRMRPQVNFLRLPSLGPWQKVFKLEAAQDQMLRTETIAAAVPGHFANPPGEFDGDIDTHHVNSTGDEGRGSLPP